MVKNVREREKRLRRRKKDRERRGKVCSSIRAG